ncbi:MAG: hypothetical protein CFE26_19900 [Verrucomicrobiales bacterium VVV1]|nr:MAG: hypothetical protein CFE26_19900 [Verrucomicrobiales bacterium VVV1]
MGLLEMVPLLLRAILGSATLVVLDSVVAAVLVELIVLAGAATLTLMERPTYIGRPMNREVMRRGSDSPAQTSW